MDREADGAGDGPAGAEPEKRRSPGGGQRAQSAGKSVRYAGGAGQGAGTSGGAAGGDTE